MNKSLIILTKQQNKCVDPEEWRQMVDKSIKGGLEAALQRVMSAVGNDNATLVIMNIVKKFVFFVHILINICIY